MLRIVITENQTVRTLKLDGTLAGPWVEELRRTWVEVLRMQSKTLELDLDATVSADDAGLKLLHAMKSSNVGMRGLSPYLRRLMDGASKPNPGRDARRSKS